MHEGSCKGAFLLWRGLQPYRRFSNPKLRRGLGFRLIQRLISLYCINIPWLIILIILFLFSLILYIFFCSFFIRFNEFSLVTWLICEQEIFWAHLEVTWIYSNLCLVMLAQRALLDTLLLCCKVGTTLVISSQTLIRVEFMKMAWTVIW